MSLTKSVCLFHISLFYNYIRLGKIFNYNQIISNDHKTDQINIELDENGNILKIVDGKKCPLILGSIPRYESDLNELANVFKVDKQKIGICSLNRGFERNWAGLTSLLKNNGSIKLYKYPTTDFTPPRLVDLIRATRDIENRDLNNHSLLHVHCKAGKSRSVTVIAAYIIHLMYKVNIDIEIEKIETYIKRIRPHIDLNNNLRNLLREFQIKLKEAKSFENLCLEYKDQILTREKSI